MRKTNGAAGKVPTHFETVPIEVVKEIAVEDLPTDRKFGVAIEKVERPAKKNLLMPVPARAPAGKKR
jgi:hypothetical protein